jgi:hypothetical protein
MTRSPKLTTNGIVRVYSRKKKPPKLTIMKLDRDTVLIEGEATALQFLGRYILAHSADDKSACGASLHPKAAGNAWFTKDATLGFYLHKLPCPQREVLVKQIKKKRKAK